MLNYFLDTGISFFKLLSTEFSSFEKEEKEFLFSILKQSYIRDGEDMFQDSCSSM